VSKEYGYAALGGVMPAQGAGAFAGSAHPRINPYKTFLPGQTYEAAVGGWAAACGTSYGQGEGACARVHLRTNPHLASQPGQVSRLGWLGLQTHGGGVCAGLKSVNMGKGDAVLIEPLAGWGKKGGPH